ncbi:MAG TPA: MFS transporter, partial [Thermomicrobiales bacterium]|nr:MFS transporter [Thermomicrobiales bacterium]
MTASTPEPTTRRLAHIDYKWIALSNTTLGVLMAALNSSIILIALPAIFRGIDLNPLAPSETAYLLWTLMGYLVVTATLLVTCGRISDMFGRVRLYNAGFAIFTVGSLALFFIQGGGDPAAIQLIGFRLVQGVGAAFLFANSTAILIDAFPPNERGMAMGINQVAAIGGSFVGLILGGLLAEVNWRGIFLISVPFGIIGTVWAYLMLHETSSRRGGQKIDVLGNVLFAGGLVLLMVALTYGLEPYGADSMGWRN